MKVLVALDGSKCSAAVLDHCLNCKWPENTKFKLITVVDFFEPLPALDSVKKKEINQAEKIVEDGAKRLMAKFPNLNVSFKVIDGYVKNELIDAATSWPADLIIVGSHGRTGFRKLLLGSVSHAVINHSACSVRVVKTKEKSEGESFKVLICLEDSKFSKKAFENLLSYQWPENTAFTLCTVLFKMPENLDIPSSAMINLEERNAKVLASVTKLLDSYEDKLKDKFGEKIPVDKLIKHGDAREELLSVTEELKPDLVLIGSHGRQVFDRMLMGSVSEAIVAHAGCPVEVVRI